MIEREFPCVLSSQETIDGCYNQLRDESSVIFHKHLSEEGEDDAVMAMAHLKMGNVIKAYNLLFRGLAKRMAWNSIIKNPRPICYDDYIHSEESMRNTRAYVLSVMESVLKAPEPLHSE